MVLSSMKECIHHSILGSYRGQFGKFPHSVSNSFGGQWGYYRNTMKNIPNFRFLYVMIVTAALLTTMAECGNRRKRRKEVENKAETTIVDFVRLLTLRLIYGIATAMGFQEGISNFMGGLLVPPGVDYDYDFGVGDDDY